MKLTMFLVTVAICATYSYYGQTDERTDGRNKDIRDVYILTYVEKPKNEIIKSTCDMNNNFNS